VNDAAVGDNGELTLFTEKNNSGHVMYRQCRPALLVSSTSWTGQLTDHHCVKILWLTSATVVIVNMLTD